MISIIAGTTFLLTKYQLDFSFFGFDKKNVKKIVSWGTISGLTLGLLNFTYTVILGKDTAPQKYFIGISP